MVGPELISLAGAQSVNVGAKYLYVAAARAEHARQKAQQCTFAAAAGTVQEQMVTALQSNIRKTEGFLYRFPGKAEPAYFN
jgi:hypothetical protein